MNAIAYETAETSIDTEVLIPMSPGIVAVFSPGDNDLVRLLKAQDLRPGMMLRDYEVPRG